MATDTPLELTPSIRSKPIKIDVTAHRPFLIEHELNCIPAGWLVIDQTAPTNIWRSGPIDKDTLTLTADQDAEITLVLL